MKNTPATVSASAVIVIERPLLVTAIAYTST
jgi:hypothetical protein